MIETVPELLERNKAKRVRDYKGYQYPCGCVKGFYWCGRHDIYVKQDRANDPRWNGEYREKMIEFIESDTTLKAYGRQLKNKIANWKWRAKKLVATYRIRLRKLNKDDVDKFSPSVFAPPEPEEFIDPELLEHGCTCHISLPCSFCVSTLKGE